MALTLDATAKGANANAYITRANADLYFDRRMDADAWLGVSFEQRELALVSATLLLEQLRYSGWKTTKAQALRWPRRGVYDDESELLDRDAVPVQLQEATCEWALDLLKTGTVGQAPTDGLDGITGISLAGISVQFDEGASGSGSVPSMVIQKLRGLVRNSSATVRMVRS